jgi:hypothetical protein
LAKGKESNAMAVSQTSFDNRLSRISAGQITSIPTKLGFTKKRRPLRARCMNVPFFVGVGILMGGTGYIFAATRPEMPWLMAFAG